MTVINDHGTVAMAFMTQRDFSPAQVDRRLITLAAKAERVVLFDVTLGLGEEHFVGIFARREKPDAAILVQNAEELLTSHSFVASIDGVAKEDLIHGIHHDGRRNGRGDIAASVALLDRAKKQGKIIYVVEYLGGPMADRVGAEIRRLGYIPHFASRSLSRAGR